MPSLHCIIWNHKTESICMLFFAVLLAYVSSMEDDLYFYYYPLDNNTNEVPMFQDPKDSSRYVTYDADSSVRLIPFGPSNQAFCVDDADTATYNISAPDISQENEFSFYVWLKHYCDSDDYMLILRSPWIKIICQRDQDRNAEQKVVLIFTFDLDCRYNIPVSNGLWYYLGVLRDDKEVYIYVNGVELQDVEKECGLPLPTPADKIKLGSLVCVDEIYATKLIDAQYYMDFFFKVNGGMQKGLGMSLYMLLTRPS